jgi:hypothetical protein
MQVGLAKAPAVPHSSVKASQRLVPRALRPQICSAIPRLRAQAASAVVEQAHLAVQLPTIPHLGAVILREASRSVKQSRHLELQAGLGYSARLAALLLLQGLVQHSLIHLASLVLGQL